MDDFADGRGLAHWYSVSCAGLFDGLAAGIDGKADSVRGSDWIRYLRVCFAVFLLPLFARIEKKGIRKKGFTAAGESGNKSLSEKSRQYEQDLQLRKLNS